MFHAFGPPPVPPGQTYQLWWIAGRKPVSAGVFEVDRPLAPESMEETIHSNAAVGAFVMTIVAMLLFVVFEAAALSHTGLARAEARRMTGGLFDTVGGVVRAAQAAGRAPTSIDPDREAIVLVSTLTSVSQGVLGGHLTIEDGRAAISYALDRALPPS